MACSVTYMPSYHRNRLLHVQRCLRCPYLTPMLARTDTPKSPAPTLMFNVLLSVVISCRLSDHFVHNDRLTATAVLVFVASPASIHHSMLYTEALFTASSWLGLYCVYCKTSSLGASLAFAVSAATRSNGKKLLRHFAVTECCIQSQDLHACRTLPSWSPVCDVASRDCSVDVAVRMQADL